MEKRISAPLLGRVKAWQLVGFGLMGWFILYAVSVLTLGTSGALMGITLGGFFAVVMALVGLEAHRLEKAAQSDALQWASEITTEQLNQSITKAMQDQEFLVEGPHPIEANRGIGVRAVNAGRTFVFETSHWKEPVINLAHVKIAEENRKKSCADYAVIVCAGTPDEDTRLFVKTHPVQLLAGKALRDLIGNEATPVEKV